MNLVTDEQLESLSRRELVALIRQLQAAVRALSVEVEKLRQPPATSHNSSQPPSRDQKSNASSAAKRKKKKKRQGVRRPSRSLVENPDKMIAATVSDCRFCHKDLRQVEPDRIIRRQITEIPPVSPFVIETQQHEVTCPQCQRLQRGVLPAGLEAERFFGPRLEAHVVWYKQTQHLSDERIVATMRQLYQVELSEGGIAAILRRAGEQAALEAEKIRRQVITDRVIKSDETSARVKARNWWQWVFIGSSGIYHHLAPTRSAAAIRAVFGEHSVEQWVSDCFTAQLKAPAQAFQLCLAHQLRDLERVCEAFPGQAWARNLKEFLPRAIHLRNRFLESDRMTISGYGRRVTQMEQKLDGLLSQRTHNALARTLRQRFLTHRDKLLPFLYDPDVPPTNNESERALRTSVIHRKVTNGFRSEWGAKAYAALQTVIATARQRGEAIFSRLVCLMGPSLDEHFQASNL